MAYKKALHKKKNPTTKVVRSAMKETAKDVREPKVVRDGIVKKKEKKINPSNVQPKINIAAKSAIDYIILDDSIKLKAKHIRNVPTFSQTHTQVMVPSENPHFKDHYVSGRFTCEDVTVELDVRMKKLASIMELFQKQRKITFTMANQNGLKIISTGFIKSIDHSLEEGLKFTYCPDYFSVL